MEQRGVAGAVKCRLQSPQRDPGSPAVTFSWGWGRLAVNGPPPLHQLFLSTPNYEIKQFLAQLLFVC